MRFAAYAARLERADPPAAYWERARRLAPTDPDLWYFSGLQQLRDHHPEDAWASFRRSLQLSPRHLAEIVDAAAPRLSPDPRRRAELLSENILPDDPELLLQAARRLQTDITADGPVRPLLVRGQAILKQRPEPLTANEYYLRAKFNEYLDDFDAALRDYDRALGVAPNKSDWRLEYAKLLMEQEKWPQAYRELLTLRRQAPSPDVEEMYRQVERRMTAR
jgi:tetratricopeptide (TPR) repeat protein